MEWARDDHSGHRTPYSQMGRHVEYSMERTWAVLLIRCHCNIKFWEKSDGK